MTIPKVTLETAERDLAELDSILAPGGDSNNVPEWPAMRRLFVGLIRAYREPRAPTEDTPSSPSADGSTPFHPGLLSGWFEFHGDAERAARSTVGPCHVVHDSACGWGVFDGARGEPEGWAPTGPGWNFGRKRWGGDLQRDMPHEVVWCAVSEGGSQLRVVDGGLYRVLSDYVWGGPCIQGSTDIDELIRKIETTLDWVGGLKLERPAPDPNMLELRRLRAALKSAKGLRDPIE